MLRSFLSGVFLPLVAIRLLISKPRLLVLAFIPFLITFGLYALGYYYLLSPVREWLHSSITPWFSQWFSPWFSWSQSISILSSVTSIMSVMFDILFTAVFLIIATFTFAWVANLASLPFNDILAGAAERHVTPTLTSASEEGFAGFIKAIVIDLKKSIFTLVVLLICFILTFIPFVNIAAILLGWFMLSFQFVSYPQTRRGIGVRAGLRQLLAALPSTIGFGAVTSLGLTIPVLACVVPPLAVIGGTILFARIVNAR